MRGSESQVMNRIVCVSFVSKTSILVVAMLALAGIAPGQTTTYKTPKPGGGWADGTMGGGYVKPDPNFKPEHTPDGQPDINGMWSERTFGVQLDSSIEALPGTKVQTRVVDPPDGMIPYYPWARPMVKDLGNNYIDPHAACVPNGAPRQTASAAAFLVLQQPDEILIVTNNAWNFRHIPLDGRPHIGKNMKLWMGDSRGHWEGKTLVIDVTNSNDKTLLSIQGDFHSDQIHSTERFTPISADMIQYEVIIEDPAVFSKPWKQAFPLFRGRSKSNEILETYCAEGNHSVENQIDAGRRLYPGFSGVKK